MKNQVILAMLTVFMVGLIASCTKKDTTPASPIGGQWDLNRYTISDVQPASYSAASGTKTYDAATSGIDSYTFKGDNTFVYTYTGSAGINTVNGTWSLSGTILTATYTTSSGASADVYTYSSSANELTSNKYATGTQITDPTSKTTVTVYFNEVDVYRLKQ